MCHLFLGYIWIKNGNCIESVCLISRKVAGECVRGRLVGKKGKQNKRRPSSDRRAWAIILLCVIICLPTSCHFWFQSHPETWKSYSGMSQILAVHKLLFYSHGFFFSGIFPVFSGSGEICAHTLPSSCPLWPPAPSLPLLSLSPGSLWVSALFMNDRCVPRRTTATAKLLSLQFIVYCPKLHGS